MTPSSPNTKADFLPSEGPPTPTLTHLHHRPKPPGISLLVSPPPFGSTLSSEANACSEAVPNFSQGGQQTALSSLLEVTCHLSLVKSIDKTGKPGNEMRGDGRHFGKSQAASRLRERCVSRSVLLMIHGHISPRSALFASEIYHSSVFHRAPECSHVSLESPFPFLCHIYCVTGSHVSPIP